MNIQSLFKSGFVEQHEGLVHKKGGHRPNLPEQASAKAQERIGVSLSLTEKVVDGRYHGVKIIGQKLSVQLGVSAERIVPKMPEFTPPSAEDVAATVLGFVEGRIRSEVASGASDERVADLLAQARKGIETGYGEAREEIEKMGIMTDELSEDIDKGYNLIDEGLTKLEQSLLPEVAADNVAVPTDEPAGEKDAPEAGEANIAPRGVHLVAGEQFNGRYERAGVTITTRDGDQVTIDLQKLSADYRAVSQFSAGFGGYQQYNQSSLNAEQYVYAIDGELDEGELTAIEDLLSQMQELADQFFSGDFEGAFTQAMKLGYDGSEIAQFSMNLTQVSVQQVGIYEEVAGRDHSQGKALGQYQPLVKFAKELLATAESAQQFHEPRVLIEKLFERFSIDYVNDDSEKPLLDKPHHDFLATLLDRIQPDQGLPTNEV